jgi:(p)ppGpp synthase/HD superfamily hydrolase
MTDELSCAAALLHDVVEDTPWTLTQLKGAGVPDPVLEALALLTHDEATPYLDYVRRLRSNPIARAVKLADLRHNSDLSRLEQVTDRDLSRLRRYEEAAALLTEK